MSLTKTVGKSREKPMALSDRLTRSQARHLAKRISDLGLEHVADPRAEKSRKWRWPALLRTVVVALAAGAKGLAEAETLSGQFSLGIKKLFGVWRPLPDTTARDALVRTSVDSVRKVLYRMCKAAWRRKALEPDGLPLHAVSMDGKSTSTSIFDDPYAQPQRPEGKIPYGLVRTITSTLVSAKARVCLDAHPVPAHTNEMGAFAGAFETLLGAYGKTLIELVMYDSGACSEENCRLVRSRGVDYLMSIKNDQPTLLAEAQRQLAGLTAEQAVAVTDEISSGEHTVRTLYLGKMLAGFHWDHDLTVVRVHKVTTHQTSGEVTEESQYFVSSMVQERLKPAQWLLLVRRRWEVENASHNTWDKLMREDERPWLLQPQGMVVVMVLRRAVYNLIALYRTRGQRSDDRRVIAVEVLDGRAETDAANGDGGPPGGAGTAAGGGGGCGHALTSAGASNPAVERGLRRNQP
jgi:hypothetical protein